jgi:hypothetical protein
MIKTETRFVNGRERMSWLLEQSVKRGLLEVLSTSELASESLSIVAQRKTLKTTRFAFSPFRKEDDMTRAIEDYKAVKSEARSSELLIVAETEVSTRMR